ncbi:MAG: hypothetical protein M3R38_05035 [Actinomycetota bacterium]|nr:hypothetical protein [Actinomycetota bacterium]
MAEHLVYKVSPERPKFGDKLRFKLAAGPSSGFGATQGTVVLVGKGGGTRGLDIHVWERRNIHATLPPEAPFSGPYQLSVVTSTGETSTQVVDIPVVGPVPCAFTINPTNPRWSEPVRLDGGAVGFGQAQPTVRLKSTTLNPAEELVLSVTAWTPPRYIDVALPAEPDRVDTLYVITVDSPETTCQSAPFAVELDPPPKPEPFPCQDLEQLRTWARVLLELPPPAITTLEPNQAGLVSFTSKSPGSVDTARNLLALGLSNSGVYGLMELGFAFRLVDGNRHPLSPGNYVLRQGALERFRASEAIELLLAPEVVPDPGEAAAKSYVVQVLGRISAPMDLCGGTIDLGVLGEITLSQLPVRVPLIAVFFGGKLLVTDYRPERCLMVVAPGAITLPGVTEQLYDAEHPIDSTGKPDVKARETARKAVLGVVGDILTLLKTLADLGLTDLPFPPADHVAKIKEYVGVALGEDEYAIVVASSRDKLSDVKLNASWFPPSPDNMPGSMFMFGAPGASISLYEHEGYEPTDKPPVRMRIPPSALVGSYETLWSLVSYTAPLLVGEKGDYSWLGDDFMYGKLSSYRIP